MSNPKLARIDGKYCFLCGPRYNDVAQESGLSWEPTVGAWYTKSKKVAAQLIEYASGEIYEELKDEALRLQANRKLSEAADADIKPECPPGLSLMPFQRAGILFLRQNKNALIADEMGLGKTVQFICRLNELMPCRALIVCPASLKINWQRELDKWLTSKPVIQVVSGTRDHIFGDIVVINYSVLSSYVEQLAKIPWRIICADESHMIKNKKAKRTKALTKLNAEFKVLMTGTPILNKPIEVWSGLNWLDKDTWGNWYRFVIRYCGGSKNRFGFDASGASNLEELNEKLRSSVMIRRRKIDVLKDLPPKVRQILEVPCDNPAIVHKELSEYEKVRKQIEALSIKADKARLVDDEEEFRRITRQLREMVFYAFKDLAAARRDTAVYKIPAIVEQVQNAADDHKVVVFAHHKEVLRGVYSGVGRNAVILYGETPQGKRDYAVQSFQSKDNVRVFVGGIKAAGVGLTLTASSHVVFGELDWTPSIVTQAEDRCHRIGQKNSVLVQHIVLHGSLDATMSKKIVDKQELIEQAVDGIHRIRVEDDTLPL